MCVWLSSPIFCSDSLSSFFSFSWINSCSLGYSIVVTSRLRLIVCVLKAVGTGDLNNFRWWIYSYTDSELFISILGMWNMICHERSIEECCFNLIKIYMSQESANFPHLQWYQCPCNSWDKPKTAYRFIMSLWQINIAM
jgi:hypothetical protein